MEQGDVNAIIRRNNRFWQVLAGCGCGAWRWILPSGRNFSSSRMRSGETVGFSLEAPHMATIGRFEARITILIGNILAGVGTSPNLGAPQRDNPNFRRIGRLCLQ